MPLAIVIEGIVIILLTVLVAGLLKSHAEILRQLHALGASEDGSLAAPTRRAPKTGGFEKLPTDTVTGVNLEGSEVSISLQQGRGSTLIAFLSSGCLSCQAFWEEFGTDFELPTPDTRTVIVTKSPGSESPSRLSELAPARLPLVMSDDAWDRFKVPMTPYFLFVDGSGMIIGEGAASSWRHLISLLRQSIRDSQSPVHADTSSRIGMTDEQLRGAGIEPGDDSLYQSPVEGP